MEKQLVDGNHVCSIYTIIAPKPDGTFINCDQADYVSLRNGKIANEKVCFFNPIEFAKEMGFLKDYLQQFQN